MAVYRLILDGELRDGEPPLTYWFRPSGPKVQINIDHGYAAEPTEERVLLRPEARKLYRNLLNKGFEAR